MPLNTSSYYFNQSVVVLDKTNSDSVTTGSMILGGGLGISGDTYGTDAYFDSLYLNNNLIMPTSNITASSGNFNLLNVSGGSTMGDLRISGDLYVSGTTYAVNTTQVNFTDLNISSGTLNVSTIGNIYALYATYANIYYANIQNQTTGGLAVTGNSILNGFVTAGALLVTGETLLNGAVSAGTLFVSSASTLAGDTLVYGTTNLVGVLNVTGSSVLTTLSASNIIVDLQTGGTLAMTNVSASNFAVDLVTGGTLAMTNVSAANFAVDLVTGGTLAMTNVSASNVSMDLVTGGTFAIVNLSSANFAVDLVTGGTLAMTNVSASNFAVDLVTGGTLAMTNVSASNFAVDLVTGGTLAMTNVSASNVSMDLVTGGTLAMTNISASNVSMDLVTIGNLYVTGASQLISGVTVGSASYFEIGITTGSLDVTGAFTLEGSFNLASESIPSESSSTGSFVTNGGVGIKEEQNAANYLNGGALTVNGGAAIRLDTYVGGNSYLGTSFISLGNTANNLVTIQGDIVVNNVDLTPSYGDLFLEQTASLPTALSPTAIPGFTFNNASVRSFDAIVSISLDTQFTINKILGIQKGDASSTGSWLINSQFAGDFIPQIELSINNSGQMLYTNSSEITGNVNFRALTTSVNL
jgi:hypothetical protein